MDERIFLAINSLSNRNPAVDRLMILVSNRIRYFYILILLFFWFKNRKVTLHSMISLLIALAFSGIIKLFYFRPRPFVHHRVGIMIPSKRNSSFPSKHTLLSFAASTSVLLFHRGLGKFMTFLSCLTGFSRVWVGHHYPFDIVWSAVLGSASSLITHFLIQKQQSYDEEDAGH
jgi:undecaprenyl-diphosphatase